MEQNLNDILVFAKVVEENSFTKAAQALGLPKSTISRRLSRLEDHLGVRLLQRTTRKLSLTDAGRLYYARSVRIVSELEDAERAVSEMQETPRGKLRVTAPVETGGGLWELFFLFLEAYPEVDIELNLTNQYIDLVKEGYDVAIRGGILPDSSLIARKLKDSNYILVATPTYLKKYGRPQKIEDLKDHQCLAFRDQTGQLIWPLKGQKGQTNIRIKGRITANHKGFLKKAALDHCGIALMPDMFVEKELASGQLEKLLCGTGSNSQGLYVVYPSVRHLAPKVRVFVDFLVAYYKQSKEENKPLADLSTPY